MVLIAPARSAHAASSAVILTGEEPGDPAARFAERLKYALAPLTTSFQQQEGGPAILARVLSDATLLGFAQRDGLAAFARENAEARATLEIYGEVPACVVALVRKDGAIHTRADLGAARRDGEKVTIDVGPAGGWTAATFSLLRDLDVVLTHSTTEHRGGLRALSRVLAGETDVLVVMAYEGTLDGTFADAIAAGALEPAPLFGQNLVHMGAVHGLLYRLGQVDLGRPGLFRAGRTHETVCTSLGVVVNARADAALAENVARVAVNGGLAWSSRRWLDEAVAYAGSAFDRAVIEARRAAASAASVAEPGIAWLTRFAAAPDSQFGKPEVRTVRNLKDDTE
ncbi:MAG: hypothetical protein HY246_05165 [Proteobacteria bacterium]|nr:hypothetical protein [Pseudomonadota bacterium]